MLRTERGRERELEIDATPVHFFTSCGSCARARTQAWVFGVGPEPILLLLAWGGGFTGSLLPLHWPVGVLLPPPSPPAVTWWKSMSRSRWGKRWTTLADFSDLKRTEQCLPAQLFQKLWTGALGSDAPRKMIQSLLTHPSPIVLSRLRTQSGVKQPQAIHRATHGVPPAGDDPSSSVSFLLPSLAVLTAYPVCPLSTTRALLACARGVVPCFCPPPLTHATHSPAP